MNSRWHVVVPWIVAWGALAVCGYLALQMVKLDGRMAVAEAVVEAQATAALARDAERGDPAGLDQAQLDAALAPLIDRLEALEARPTTAAPRAAKGPDPEPPPADRVAPVVDPTSLPPQQQRDRGAATWVAALCKTIGANEITCIALREKLDTFRSVRQRLRDALRTGGSRYVDYRQALDEERELLLDSLVGALTVDQVRTVEKRLLARGKNDFQLY